jgi:hypothetical protein
MSPIGRIFIVLNLILAALFLGWAATHLGTSQDFKKRHETTQAEFDQYKEEKEAEANGLRAQIAQQEDSMSNVRGERDTADADRARLQSDLETARSRNTALDADVKGINASLSNYDETNRQLQARLEQATTDSRAADEARRDAEDGLDAAEEAQRTAEEQLASSEKRIADMEADHTGLQRQVQDLDTQLQTLVDYTGVSAAEIIAMPVIDGAVLQVVNTTDPGLVAINKGQSDGVKRGFTFDIYHGSQYKGQVRVESVQPNMCTAVIIRTVDGARIGQGDAATTRI